VNTLDAIHNRRSIRKYLDKPVPPDVLRQVLSAAMYAPSACNQQPWQFVVLDDRKLLREVPKINSYAAMAAQAPVAILVCGDSSLETVPGYWVIDCSAAVQNLLLAAHALGLGAVWTGVYPQQTHRIHHARQSNRVDDARGAPCDAAGNPLAVFEMRVHLRRGIKEPGTQ
jgi:nitroreductase